MFVDLTAAYDTVWHCGLTCKLVQLLPNGHLVRTIMEMVGNGSLQDARLATFPHERLEWSLVDKTPEQSEAEWLCVDFAGYKIINIYKPPRSRLTPTAIPTFPHPILYVSDFSCQHVNWGYNKTSRDGESLDSWATFNNLGLLYDPKEAANFSSHPCNVGTNPDLAFASFGQDSRLSDRRVLGKSPQSGLPS